jgi:hypothetical protein
MFKIRISLGVISDLQTIKISIYCNRLHNYIFLFTFDRSFRILLQTLFLTNYL